MTRRFRHYPQIGGRDDRVYDTEVDYIQSTGTQYIELPYRLGPNVKFEFKANWVSPSVGGYPSRRWGQNSSSWECFIDSRGGYFANSNLGSAHVNELGVDYTYIFDLTSGALKLVQNGVVLKSSTGTYPVKNPIGIFGIRGAAQGTLDTFAVCRLYYFKLWVDGVLVVDAIPVRKGSKGFLYDRISGEPLETLGGGDFIVGPDKRQYTALDYVQDGLIAMWDGIENAGWGTHGNVSSWRNLGSRFGDFILDGNFEWLDDCIKTNGYAGKLIGKITDRPLTVEICSQIDEYNELGTYKNAVLIQFGHDTSSFMMYAWGDRLSVGVDETAVGYSNQSSFASIGSIADSIGKKNTYSAFISNSSNYASNIHLDGVLQSNLKSQGQGAGNAGFATLGNQTTTNQYRPFFGRVYSIRFYDRELTDAEVAKNYVIDHRRFGLA